MARVKMFAGRVAGGTAVLATAGMALAVVYSCCAIAAHMGTWIEWR